MSPSPIRSFHHEDFSSDDLVTIKAGSTVAVCLPARNEEATIGPIVTEIHRQLVVEHPVVDELVVIDDQSTDETAAVAADAGAQVVSTSDLLPHLAKGPGKGQALWKSLHATTSDLIAWCDADITGFDCRLVRGIIGPLLAEPTVGFVKGHYDRPLDADGSGGGRVTELTARPLISALFPQLAVIAQPLAGEYGGRRQVLEQVRFASGYGVELGLLIDIAERFGVEAIAQSDLGERRHRNRGLDELGPQAAAIVHTALRRAAPGLVAGAGPLIRPGAEPIDLEVDDHPPMVSVTDYLLDHLPRPAGPETAQEPA